MSFNSIDYILLLAATLILYYVLPHKFRNWLLLLSSLAFYAAYSLKLTLFLLVMILITYYFALDIEKSKEADSDQRSKKLLKIGLIICIGILAFYKYSDFILDTFSGFAGNSKVKHLNLIAPLGISFIVFSLVSYLIDVYRGKIHAEHNLLKYALFVAFFPKVVQGPIVRAGDLIPQFDEVHTFDRKAARAGFIMILYGLFSKLVVADAAAVAVNQIYASPSDYSGAALTLGTVLFALQIYCDFAGYSLIAIGSAKLLGFRIDRNFQQPYCSRSVGEFWRRWHMSLNTWLRDYLYIPLGGSRCSKNRRSFNLLVTFGLSGLWHGADWGYIIWGLLNGVYVDVEGRIKSWAKKRNEAEQQVPGTPVKHSDPDILDRIIHMASVLLTFCLVSFSWIFFRAQKLSKASLIIRRMFGSFNYSGFIGYIHEQIAKGAGTSLYGLDVMYGWPKLLVGLVIVIAVDVLAQKNDIPERVANGKLALRWFVYIALIMSILVCGVYGFGYDASAFIYAGF